MLVATPFFQYLAIFLLEEPDIDDSSLLEQDEISPKIRIESIKMIFS